MLFPIPRPASSNDLRSTLNISTIQELSHFSGYQCRNWYYKDHAFLAHLNNLLSVLACLRFCLVLAVSLSTQHCFHKKRYHARMPFGYDASDLGFLV